MTTWLKLVLILLLLLLLLCAAVMIYAYRLAFYVPEKRGIPGEDAPLYNLPQGAGYEALMPGIKRSIERMVERPFEPVTVTSFDGLTLFGRYYHVQDGAPVQIQFHGYRSSGFVDFSGGSYLAAKLGHNALVVDQRSHGRSKGRAITFGVLERQDCISWSNYVIERFGPDTRIVLAGLSMGAATVLMASDLPLPANVKAITADCPYSSPRAIIQKVSRDIHFPAKLTYPLIRLSAKLFAHFDPDAASAVSSVSRSELPVLLLHGEADDFVPCDMSREIYRNAPEGSVLVTVPGAGHGLCYTIAPQRYEAAVQEYLERQLGQ